MEANTDQKITRRDAAESEIASTIIWDPHKPCIARLKGKITETEMRWEADITLDMTYALQSNNGF
jgi:hypothetical protein